MKIFIEDYNEEIVYSFDPQTGKRFVVTDVGDNKVGGYGLEMKIGFLKRKKKFIAVYPHNETLVLWIDGKQMDLRSKGLRIQRISIPLTFTHYFCILKDSEVFMEFWYTYITFETWPDDGDIFSYITERLASSRESVERAFFRMKAGDQLRDIEDPSEMDDYFKKQLNK